MSILQKYLVPILLLSIFLVRTIIVFLISEIPCMDHMYYAQAMGIISAGKTEIFLTPSYGLILFFFAQLFNNLLLGTSILFILFSSATAWVVYLIAKRLFNRRTGIVALVILLFIPGITVAVAGYSHTMAVSSFFVLFSMYVLVRWWQNDLTLKYGILFFSLSSIAAIYIRPESLFITFGLFLTFFLQSQKTIRQRLYFAGTCIIFIFSFIQIHGYLLKTQASNPSMGTFADTKYSYMTYIHTLSLRAGEGINDTVALRLSIDMFGTPESNDWSILNAVLKNPKVAAANVVYNIKEALDHLPNRIYFPFYLYIFFGFALFKLIRDKAYFILLILLIVWLMALFPTMVFHNEIRYLGNVIIPLILLTAFGLDRLENKKELYISLAMISILNFAIFIAYLINNIQLESLCG